MRYLDRMRTGVALGALLLCLTSTTVTLTSGPRESVSAALPAPTLAAVCHTNPESERLAQLFRQLGDRQPLAVLRRRDGEAFQSLMHALASSPQVQTGGGEIAGVIVLYSRTGRVDHILKVTRDGLLYDPAVKQYFRAGDEVLRFAAQVLGSTGPSA
ncbi:MAG: hypothetical protein K6T81_00265 [Alicyclobacillus macrosporangiidus]|uniref:hypothetical protein n=1 Tax=Alicyclobacillus macrosporangiidus TaxID=392015 RepID=UPI0026F000E8|nr:hypothetical protein [Alicyclobacillus macrosporangiidus]MCL6597156.1 hypothetical protein [Alicyclobacillus macrosporangiidus]